MSIISILHQGQWQAATIVGYGRDGNLVHAYLNEPYVTITTTGTTFSPKLQLRAGSSAIVRWLNLDTGQSVGIGTNPTIIFGSSTTRHIGFRVESHGVAAFEDVITLNLGFNHNEDAGAYNIGSSYDYASQSISGVASLQLLTGLKRFLAAGTGLTGHLNVSGLTQLEFIECFGAHVQSIDLTGCTSLIRLCMEANSLSTLNLNPVRGNLRDLRAAVQNSPSLTFTTLTGPMAQLYHYCIRDQTVINIIPHAQLPVIEEHWAWNTGQTTSDAPTSAALRSYASYQNPYDQASVDLILTTLAALITNGAWHSVDLSGGAIPSASGQAAATTLQSNGWTVIVAS